jgi:hypothetical protein
MEKMIPRISKRGFLFTLSAILFATTLVIYSQTFLGISYGNEKAVINASAVGTLANINDSISFNMRKIVGVEVDANSAGDINIFVRERIPKGYNVAQKISDFEAMLNGAYFPRVAGNHVLDASGIRDGTAEILAGSVASIDSNYAGNETTVRPTGANAIRSIDINIYVDGPRDSEEINVAGGGVADVGLSYADTNAAAGSISQSFPDADTGLASAMVFRYPGDENVVVLLGEVGSLSESFRITNNSSHNLYYDIRVNYAQGADYLPVRLNAVLMQQLGSADANTMLKILN